MPYEEKASGAPQKIVCENREKLEVTGILEVMIFDEQSITARTSQGELTVRGSGLHVDRLSLDSGELSLTGRIGAIEYTDEERGGFFSRLFG
ncbi:MAG: sporulation protein YabP [Clostridiales bacterium]|jgi:sporulation protein YabP|nr:sporulation protein YabP [Clostridiales bacterium]